MPKVSDPAARLARFWREAMRCRVCPTLAPWRKFDPASRGTPRYAVMIVGEAPGRVSLENGRPFSNPRNLTVRRAWARALADAPEPEAVVYFTDVVKCWPASATGANRSPLSAEVRTCVERHLTRELEIVRPRLVVAFGARAAAAILGRPVAMAAAHARPVRGPGGARVIPLMHPSSINIAGMRRVGIRSLDDYEAQLARLIRREVRALGLADKLRRRD
jgi:uracil-DNA glycosylase